ncbi:MAG: M4 family metallopeptidase [Chloroflexota bacterium]
MDDFGPLFGLRDQAQELKVKRDSIVNGGRFVVRFTQVYREIPVFAGEVIVHLDANRNVQVATGELLPDISVDTQPTVSSGQAADTARAVTGRAHGVQVGALTTIEPELRIYNRSLVGDPGPRLTRLVWQVVVRAGALEPIRQLVLVDAQSGGVLLSFNQVPDAKNRVTYTSGGTSARPGTLVCTEANPTPCDADQDAQEAHRYAGDTYDFYATRHGRDGINGAGGTLISSVHWFSAGVCPNAFWDGTQMTYCDGAAKDDIVGHELTHGVTEFESGLLYFRQAGAINESFSDVWGEFVDQVNGSGTDTVGVKWQIGEDAAAFGGAIRNMANPPDFNDPDKMTSGFFQTSNADNGGVHGNSGLNNKAAFLLTDGGTFNGRTVSGLGMDKTAKIYYEAQTSLLTPGSDYADLYNALQQACFNITGQAGISVDDCQEVQDAVNAVEMNLSPLTGAPPMAPMCPTGQSPVDVFFDNLENTASGNWISSTLLGPNRWSYPQSAANTNTTSGIRNIHGNDGSTLSDSVMARSASVVLPANAFLRFNHAYSFDTEIAASVLRYWDGGILQYSTNNGLTWTNASLLFTHGGYSGTLRTTAQGNNNPLQGQQAWVGNSDYGSTRLDLSSLAGQSFRFRFRLGTDSVFGDFGWFIDDVRIYTCSAGPAAGYTVSPTNGLTTSEAGGTAVFTVRLNTVPTGNVTIGLSSSDSSEGSVGPTSLLFTPLNALQDQTVTVRGVDDAVVDGNVAYSIVTAPATSTDADYSGLDAPNISVSNTDNEVCPTHARTITPNGTGGYIVTLTASGANMTEVLFQGAASGQVPGPNAIVDIQGGPSNQAISSNFTYTLPGSGASSLVFTLRRQAAGQAVTLPLEITVPGCAVHRTFVGAGPGAP